MKKFISISAALLIGVASFAQEDQIKDAEKALKKGDLNAASESLMSAGIDMDKLYSYDPKIVSSYLYTRASVCDQIGVSQSKPESLVNASKLYTKLVEFEKGQYHYAKNIASGEVEYFASAEDMNNAVAAGTHKGGKSKDIKDYHTKDVKAKADALALVFHQGAIDAYNAEDFKKSREYFEYAYDAYQNPLIAKQDTVLLFNAAAVGISEKNYQASLDIYLKLLDMNYTGKKLEFRAESIETGEMQVFSSKNERDIQVKTGLFKNPSQGYSEDAQPSIYRTIASIYSAFGDELDETQKDKKLDYYHKAIDILKAGRAKYPNDQDMLLSLGNLYLKDGNQEGFINAMKEAVTSDPNNEVLYYNIGVISAELGLKNESKEAYLKAIELKPNYVDAYINLAYNVLNREKDINKEISDLPIKLNKKDQAKLKALNEEKTAVYKEAAIYLEGAYNINKTNIAVLQTLKNIYYALDKMDDYKRVKKELDVLEAAQ